MLCKREGATAEVEEVARCKARGGIFEPERGATGGAKRKEIESLDAEGEGASRIKGEANPQAVNERRMETLQAKWQGSRGEFRMIFRGRRFYQRRRGRNKPKGGGSGTVRGGGI